MYRPLKVTLSQLSIYLFQFLDQCPPAVPALPRPAPASIGHRRLLDRVHPEAQGRRPSQGGGHTAGVVPIRLARRRRCRSDVVRGGFVGGGSRRQEAAESWVGVDEAEGWVGRLVKGRDDGESWDIITYNNVVSPNIFNNVSAFGVFLYCVGIQDGLKKLQWLWAVLQTIEQFGARFVSFFFSAALTWKYPPFKNQQILTSPF